METKEFRRASAALAGAPAHAQVQLIERVSGSELQRLIQAWGYRADLSTDSESDPIIRSAMSGATVTVVFYGCTKEDPKRCDSLQLSSGFILKIKPSREKIDEWNRAQRYLKTFLDKEDDPFAQYDVSLVGGVSADNLKDVFRKFDSSLGKFMSFVK